MAADPVRDKQTVTPEGKSVKPLIDGVKLRYAVTHIHEDGSITEILNPAWGFHPDPLVYIYQFTVSPRHIRAWVIHRQQDDRVFVSQGKVKIVLYDERPKSPTFKMINEIFLSEHNRALLTYPSNIWHAVENIGDKEALIINMPNKPYDHTNPDKFRLPLENDVIPYKFKSRS
jgi:dTDP-4-dehydrorhamnose 3,5-epimerase